MEVTQKIRYRVITPGTFSDLTGFHPNGKQNSHYKAIETLDEAKEAVRQFGSSDSDSEYAEYWKEQGEKCVIVRETTITETDNESEIDVMKTIEDLKAALNRFVQNQSQWAGSANAVIQAKNALKNAKF